MTLVYFEEIERDQYDYAATGSDGRNLSDGGMGLGLGIARGIIEAHGGALLLSNHPGGGLNAVIRLSAAGPSNRACAWRPGEHPSGAGELR